MKNKNKLTRPICFIALLTLILPILFGVHAGAEEKYDYSHPTSLSNVTVSSAELLEAYLGKPLSRAEHDYLDTWGSVRLYYSPTVTSDRVVSEYNSGTLKVKAYTYSYTAECGTELTWVPSSISIGGESKAVSFDGECYPAEFFEIEEDESLFAAVEYKLELTIDKDDLYLIANQAYENAPILAEEVARLSAEYERLNAEYLSDKADYEAYLSALAQFELDTVKYREYLLEKKLYDDALAEYKDYLLALDGYNEALKKQEDYNVALEKYNLDYKAYLDYLGKLSEYNANLENYNKYLKNLETARSHINIIDTAAIKMTSLERDVYSAVMGNLVTEVLVANKDVLTSPAVGAKKEVIDAAGEATEVLRKLLPGYFSLKTEEEKYSYYSLNFEAFRDNFIQLTQALDELYRNRRIRAEIITQGRGEKYVILVCQLAIISNALYDGPIESYYGEYKFDTSYRIEKKTVKEWLDNKTHIPNGIDPSPLENGYPRELAEPIAPETVKEPTPPTPIKVPAKPDEVLNPGDAPEEVPEPKKPQEVKEPIQPDKYEPDSRILSLIAAYNNGEVESRQGIENDFTYIATTVFQKKLFGVTEVTVVFHDTDGTVVQMSSLDKNTPVVYTGPVPQKQEDASATYAFIGWQDSMGKLYDLSSIPEDLMLYPLFSADTKYYDVTFDVDGELTTISCPYGSVPVFDKTPTKADEGGIMYTFRSWDRELTEVRGNTTYTARFDTSYILPFENGGADITVDDGFYYADCIRSQSSAFDISSLLSRAASSNMGIVLKTRFANVTFPLATVISMHGAEDSKISLSVVQKGAYGYSYKITVSGKSASDASYKLSASFPCKLPDTANNSLFFLKDNERSYVNYNLSNGRLDFKLTSGIEYNLLAEYRVNVIASDLITLTASSLVAHNGDSIFIDASVADGYRIVRLLVFDSEGNEYSVIGGAFTMPSCDVTVAAEVEAIKYTVTFMDGDKVIGSYIYSYGDTVVPPKDPVKLGDSRHNYTFIGWSSELVKVTEDVTYFAVYKTTLIPPPEQPDGLQISPSVMKLIIAFFIAVFMLLLVVIPSGVLLTVTVLRERKKFIKKSKG